jgi:Sad1 / UNC-like C-terminal
MTTFSTRSIFLLSAFASVALSAGALAKEAGSSDLMAFANGGRVLEHPDFPAISSMSAGPLNLIDGSAATDWEGETGEITFVFELAETTELHRIAFDTAGLNKDAKSAKDFVVEVSETSPTKGFSEVLGGTLKMAKNGQSFSFKPEERPTAQWVRLTILNNYGEDYTAFTGFHVYGDQLTQEATLPDLTGKYDGASGWGRINLFDTDEGISGCYAYQQGEFEGVVEGRVLKLSMHQRADGQKLDGLFQLMDNGELVGIVRNEGKSNLDFYATYYSAEKAGGKPNSC